MVAYTLDFQLMMARGAAGPAAAAADPRPEAPAAAAAGRARRSGRLIGTGEVRTRQRLRRDRRSAQSVGRIQREGQCPTRAGIGTAAARRSRRNRFRADFSGALRDAAAREGRGGCDQGRAAVGRAAAAAGAAGDQRDVAVRDAEPEQARRDLEPQASARARAAVRDGQAGRRAAGEFLAGHDGRSRGRLVGAARDQPAPDLRDRHRVRHQRPGPRQSRDGPDDPGRLRHHERDRRAGRAADEGRADPGRFHGRHPPLRRDHDRAL